SSACGVSTRIRSLEGSEFVRPMRNSSTSNLPLYSTTVSKIRSIRCESIRWPSASTTSCCMGNLQDNAEVRREPGEDAASDIIWSESDTVIRTQVSLDEREYALAKKEAKALGIPVAEYVRR